MFLKHLKVSFVSQLTLICVNIPLIWVPIRKLLLYAYLTTFLQKKYISIMNQVHCVLLNHNRNIILPASICSEKDIHWRFSSERNKTVHKILYNCGSSWTATWKENAIWPAEFCQTVKIGHNQQQKCSFGIVVPVWSRNQGHVALIKVLHPLFWKMYNFNQNGRYTVLRVTHVLKTT